MQLDLEIPASRIAERVAALADELATRYRGRDLLVVPLLGGAFCFVADLVRRIDHPDLQLHFAGASSYGGGTSSGGRVTLRDLPDCRDREVLVVDDILDTGRTLQTVRDALRGRGARTVASCVLLDKPARRVVPIQAEWVGFTISDRFVVGYGMDHLDRYRHLPDIWVCGPTGRSLVPDIRGLTCRPMALEPTARELALHALRKMRDKGGEDLVLLHLPSGRRQLFDYVLIGTGRSERQVATLVEEVYHFCKRHGIPRFPVEGDGAWRLVDCHEVVAHALTEEQRARFRLEALWPDAERVAWEAELAQLHDPDLDLTRER